VFGRLNFLRQNSGLSKKAGFDLKQRKFCHELETARYNLSFLS